MELKRSREAVSCLATQELQTISWEHNFHHSVYKSYPLVQSYAVTGHGRHRAVGRPGSHIFGTFGHINEVRGPSPPGKISVEVCIDPRTIARPEKLGQLLNHLTESGIELPLHLHTCVCHYTD
jgi:hypothetical protein